MKLQCVSKHEPNQSASYLMLHVVLHVDMTTSKNFKAEGTEEILCVFMHSAKVCLHFRKE